MERYPVHLTLPEIRELREHAKERVLDAAKAAKPPQAIQACCEVLLAFEEAIRRAEELVAYDEEQRIKTEARLVREEMVRQEADDMKQRAVDSATLSEGDRLRNPDRITTAYKEV